MPLVVAIMFALLSAVVLPQRRGSAVWAQNHGGGATPQSSSIPANAREYFPRPSWTVKYDSGSLGLKPGQWLKIAFASRTALAQINPYISAPAGQLVIVEFDAKTEKESGLLQGPRSGCNYARSMMPDTSKNLRPDVVVATALSAGLVSRLAERLRPKHPVRFVWNESGEQKSMIVRVNDCEYQSFIANIRWMVGQRWQDIRRN
jgi:hypothetical protein